MIDFDKLNVGDEVIINLGSVAYRYGYNRVKWSMSNMIVDSVTDKKKTQFTTSKGFRFSKNGVSADGRGVKADHIDGAIGWNSGVGLIESVISRCVIEGHKEKIKKITEAQSMVDARYSAFSLHKLNSIDDAVAVARKILEANELMKEMMEAQGEK